MTSIQRLLTYIYLIQRLLTYIERFLKSPILNLQIHCNTYFDLVGEREAKCTSDGWENTDTKCANAQG